MDRQWDNDSKEIAKELLRRAEELKRAREPFHAAWDSIAELFNPAYLGFQSYTNNLESQISVSTQTTDTTSRRSAQIFTAGMLSGVSSPQQRWFNIDFDNPDLNRSYNARLWGDTVENQFYKDLAAYAYYREQHHAYLMTGLFGWQCLLVEELSPTGPIAIKSMPLPQIFIAEDHTGMVDTVYRRFHLTARQAVQKFGKENLPLSIQNAYAKSPNASGKDKLFEFLHAVFPREDRNTLSLKRNNLAYASFYVSIDETQVVREGGYAELPYIVSRAFRIPNTAYGYSPGTESLADVKMINEMKRLILEAGQLATAPPYWLPDDGFVRDISYEPWALNYYKKQEGLSPADFAPMQIGQDPRFAFELLKEVREDIKAAFFVDLFLTVTNRSLPGQEPVTATEVMELVSEKMFLLGPILINQQVEGFQSFFARLYSLLDRRGQLPPPPPELINQSFKMQYSSPLITAQMESQNSTVLKTFQDIGILAQGDQAVLDNFSFDGAARLLTTNRGVPAEMMRDPEQVAIIRQMREQQQQMAMQQQQLLEAAQVAPALGKKVEDGSILKNIAGALTQ